MYGQQKRNMIHTSSTAYEQDHSAAAHNPRASRPGGGSCCNLMDCRPTQSRMVGDHYEVKPHGGCWKCEDSAGETNGRSRYSSRNVRRSLGITPCADADCPRSLAHLAARLWGVPGQVPTLWQGISPGSLEQIVATACSIARSTYAPHRNLGIALHPIPGPSGFPRRPP